MNCNEANEILIADFLFSRGIEPKKVSGHNYWYLSPLRDEKTASFKVDTNINRWYDHGIGVGGKLVDLGIRLHQESVSNFLDRLDGAQLAQHFSFVKPEVRTTIPVVKKVKAIENKALVEYLTDRGISLPIAQTFCHEVYFTASDKNYFGIGFKNDYEGFEIRNKFFKGCIGSKTITTLEGPNPSAWILFEGFFDFLSALQTSKIATDYSFIILNSVNQIDQAIAELSQNHPDSIIAYFDNDDAGRKCFQTLSSSFPTAKDFSDSYKGYKDFNEMIMQTKIQNYG